MLHLWRAGNKQIPTVKLDSGIKNLIFDLGGVIIDLSIEDTLKSFATLASKDLEIIRTFYNSAPEFISYEIGEMTDVEFRQFINHYCAVTHADITLDRCWNGMLRGLPKSKLDLILSLKNKYN